jgi:hypothetical protein
MRNVSNGSTERPEWFAKERLKRTHARVVYMRVRAQAVPRHRPRPRLLPEIALPARLRNFRIW